MFGRDSRLSYPLINHTAEQIARSRMTFGILRLKLEIVSDSSGHFFTFLATGVGPQTAGRAEMSRDESY